MPPDADDSASFARFQVSLIKILYEEQAFSARLGWYIKCVFDRAICDDFHNTLNTEFKISLHVQSDG